MHSAIDRRLGERGADRERHVRRRARRRHQSRQHAGEKRGAVAVALGEAVADAGQPAADFEDAGQVQAYGQQQVHEQGDEQRRLQLEAPADLFAARTKRQQHGRQAQHGADDTGGEHQTLGAHGSGMLLCLFDQAQWP